jgi:hypothetical protein
MTSSPRLASQLQQFILRRHMPNIRAALRRETGFPDSSKSRHNALPDFAECGIMTMTFVWTGVALWLALNAAVAVCLLAAQPGRRTPDRAPYRN